MAQASETRPLRLSLTPMQVSDTTLQPIVAAKASSPQAVHSDITAIAVPQETVKGCQLVLYPGESSEIVVQLQNLSNSPIYLNMRLIEPSFPAHWCQIHQEGQQLPPHSKMEAVLHFTIPSDFFESHEGWQADTCLILDYGGTLEVRYGLLPPETPVDGPLPLHFPYLQAAAFHLFVRPHSLYLNFLPSLYREVDFIGRLLKIFEETFEPAVHTIDSLWAYLDPLTAPESLLPFLAHWVGWQLTPSLSLQRQRYLIKQAIALYRWRGTKRGLRFYLHLYTHLPLDEDLPETEKHIRIQENFGRGFVTGETYLGRDSTIGGGQPFHFTVQLQFDNPMTLEEKQLCLRLCYQIIEQEKPAFCTYELELI
ncbi:MAG: phage tail protein [Jaaginema sp. PMC 1079.18]|nr:phage tail protein [Jaaginema sp. PMC 1080.18]MEC4851274.1 phage tail protein [Jaaginema sp. PMC 1079.18]MEC4867607.1 phage tail protein [Jaaginema sp. PMC 1078.18]